MYKLYYQFMVTNFTIKGTIAQNQIDVILGMLRSWNIDVEVGAAEQVVADASNLSFSTDLWTDYDFDDQSLRAKAWGILKRTHNDTL